MGLFDRGIVYAVTVGVVWVAVLATPGSAGVSWRADLETENLDQWDCGVQQKESGRATIVTSPVRQGRYAARYEVRAGDNNVAGSGVGERSESLSCRSFGEGEEQWWAWSTMFAPGFSASNSGWNLFTQWHPEGSTGGSVAFVVSGKTLRFKSFGGDISNATTRSCVIADKVNGIWYDIVFHVKWSANPTVGFVEVWVNGTKVVERTQTATLYNRKTVYLKQGYYRAPQPNVGVIYHDGMRQGTSYADVAAEFPEGSAPARDAPARIAAGGCGLRAPRVVVAPESKGAARPAGVLTVTKGQWDPAPTGIRYQWQTRRDGSRSARSRMRPPQGGTHHRADNVLVDDKWTDLKGKTGRSLVLPSTLSASSVRVVVTASNAAGSSTVASAPIHVTRLVEGSAAKRAGLGSIDQNLRPGQTLKGAVVWKANPASRVKQIEFAIDDNKVNYTDTRPPYSYTLDTTKLADGEHTFGLTVTRVDGSVVWKPYQIGILVVRNRSP